MPRAHPMRSATTVAGIVGQSFSSARIRSSKASTADVCRGRRYEGGSPDLTATRTVLRATPTRFAIVLMHSVIRQGPLMTMTSPDCASMITTAESAAQKPGGSDMPWTHASS